MGDQKEADLIASTIVEERLVSSVNIVDSVRSYYWWSSALQQQEEFLLIAKTRTAVVNAAIERIRDIHSYECPCIVSWPIEKGNKDYLEWIGRETDGTGISWVTLSFGDLFVKIFVALAMLIPFRILLSHIQENTIIEKKINV